MVKSPLRVLFVGSVVPDTAEFRTRAFSRAGNLAQQGLLDGLSTAGAELNVLSFLPVPAFPAARRVLVAGQRLRSPRPLRLLPMLNLPYLKQLCIAAGILLFGGAAILRRRPTVLMSYNVNSFVAAPLQLLSRLSRVPYVPVVYDVDLPGATVPDGPYQRWEHTFARRFLPHVPGAVVGTRRIAAELLPGQPHVLVEGGLHEEQRRYAAAPRGSRQTFNIVFAGALERYNGVDVMLEALAQRPDPHLRLHIAGQGRLRGDVEAAARQDSRIVFHGLLDMEQLAALYAEGDLLINHRSDQRLDSRYVFPSKLIEYLASGLPVVSTRFRSLPEEYLPHLILLPDESPAALAQAIEDVAQRPHEARERAAAAQQFALQHKAWTVQGQRIRAFLETL